MSNIDSKIEPYIDDWSHPLPNDVQDVLVLRGIVAREMQSMRRTKLNRKKRTGYNPKNPQPKKNYRRSIDAHAMCSNDKGPEGHRYRSMDRLRRRLNLLLRYYGFEGCRGSREDSIDFLAPLYRMIMAFSDDLRAEEQAYLNWVKSFFGNLKDTEGFNANLKDDFIPPPNGDMDYNTIRQKVHENFTGEETDLDAWDNTPEYWVASDEWHTERIRRERARHQQSSQKEPVESQ